MQCWRLTEISAVNVSSIACPRQRLLAQVCAALDVDIIAVKGPSRLEPLVRARYLFACVARRRWPDLSYPRIGRLLGGRDHSTIIHGLRQFEAVVARDPQLQALVAQLVSARELVQHDAHVWVWLGHITPDRHTVPPVRSISLSIKDFPVNDRAVVLFVQSGRRVKQKNVLAADDHDAVRRKVGSDALSAAIAAAGGWR